MPRFTFSQWQAQPSSLGPPCLSGLILVSLRGLHFISCPRLLVVLPCTDDEVAFSRSLFFQCLLLLCAGLPAVLHAGPVSQALPPPRPLSPAGAAAHAHPAGSISTQQPGPTAARSVSPCLGRVALRQGLPSTLWQRGGHLYPCGGPGARAAGSAGSEELRRGGTRCAGEVSGGRTLKAIQGAVPFLSGFFSRLAVVPNHSEADIKGNAFCLCIREAQKMFCLFMWGKKKPTNKVSGCKQ